MKKKQHDEIMKTAVEGRDVFTRWHEGQGGVSVSPQLIERVKRVLLGQPAPSQLYEWLCLVAGVVAGMYAWYLVQSSHWYWDRDVTVTQTYGDHILSKVTMPYTNYLKLKSFYAGDVQAMPALQYTPSNQWFLTTTN